MNRKVEKILFVIPNFNWKENVNPSAIYHNVPYGLCLMAAMLEKDYVVNILDANIEDLSREQFAGFLAKTKPDMLCISVLTDYFGVTAHIATAIAKSVNENIVTVLGGVYATTNAEKALINDENLDYLIVGEGEYTLCELVKSINNYCADDDISIRGIYYKRKDKVIKNGRAEFITDLDALPLPAYHLIDFSFYSNAVKKSGLTFANPTKFPFAALFTSRGCPFSCSFCQVESIAGKSFRGRSAESVLQEIDFLIENYGIKSIVFYDDNLFMNRDRIKKILCGLVERKIEWKAPTVAAFLLDDELMELMKLSGCKYFGIAIESGNKRVLRDIIGKPIKFDKIKSVVKKAKELEIFLSANFIIGFPTETWDEIRETLKFAEEIEVDYVNIYPATPLPNTRLFEMAEKYNCLSPDYDFSKIDWVTCGCMETKDFKANDLTILRVFEWDRINFSTPEKIEKIQRNSVLTIKEIYEMRRNTIENMYKNLSL